jgi:hypothetical protein
MFMVDCGESDSLHLSCGNASELNPVLCLPGEGNRFENCNQNESARLHCFLMPVVEQDGKQKPEENCQN